MNFFKLDPGKKAVKEAKQDKKQAYKVTEMVGDLAKCEDFFISVIRNECINIEKRRKLRVSDREEKGRVRDAVIGFLAVEELALDLPSVQSEQMLDKALGRLSRITLKMQLLAPGTPSIGMREIFKEMDVKQDNSVEPVPLTLRAKMVDEIFLDKLIQGTLEGRNIKNLIHKLLENYVERIGNDDNTGTPDFTDYVDDIAVDTELLEEFENLR